MVDLLSKSHDHRKRLTDSRVAFSETGAQHEIEERQSALDEVISELETLKLRKSNNTGAKELVSTVIRHCRYLGSDAIRLETIHALKVIYRTQVQNAAGSPTEVESHSNSAKWFFLEGTAKALDVFLHNPEASASAKVDTRKAHLKNFRRARSQLSEEGISFALTKEECDKRGLLESDMGGP